MGDDTILHIKPTRLRSLPETMRRELKAARLKRRWSQAELGRRARLPQAHVSGIETGKIVPRFNTLIDLVRLLEHDLVLVPRALVPAVSALIRDSRHSASGVRDEELPLYAAAPEEDAGEDRDVDF